MFFLIILFSSVMYVGTRVFLGMLKEFYDDKNSYLLEIAYCAIFTGVYFVRNLLNISSMLYLLLFIYIVYELFLIISYCKSFLKFVKIEGEY